MKSKEAQKQADENKRKEEKKKQEVNDLRKNLAYSSTRDRGTKGSLFSDRAIARRKKARKVQRRARRRNR